MKEIIIFILYTLANYLVTLYWLEHLDIKEYGKVTEFLTLLFMKGFLAILMLIGLYVFL